MKSTWTPRANGFRRSRRQGTGPDGLCRSVAYVFILRLFSFNLPLTCRDRRQNGEMMATILLLNGPNLNLLGTREPDVYGSMTLAAIEKSVAAAAGKLGHGLEAFQSNAEAELVDRVQDAAGHVEFILLNPGGFTHTSVALRDALLAVGIPFVEIHISNIYGREDFRKKSYYSDIAVGTIAGLGPQGYELALLAAHQYLQDQTA